MVARRIAVGVFLSCVATSRIALTLSAADDVSALVSELRGSASVEEVGRPRREVQLYDWVAEKATITVGKHSTVVLVLATGARFELGENARVTVLREGLSTSPTVRALPALPPLPMVAPIASSTAPGGSGAVRIRGSSFRNLYPSGDATLADSTTLRFDGPRGAIAFVVTIEDAKGPVFDVKTVQRNVVVPPGVLDAGRPYYWRVAVAGDSTPAYTTEATFATLPASITEARRALMSGLRRDDAHDLVLLARIDERLGLLIEARDDLAAAAARAPDDRQVQQMLAGIEKQLTSPR